MKTPPTSTLIVTQAEVLLQILVVALDASALMGNADQLIDRRVQRQGGQEALARFGFACRPLDEQPLLEAQACFADISASMTQPNRRKALAQRRVGALAPSDRLECLPAATTSPVL
jgi:hypothetical protein